MTILIDNKDLKLISDFNRRDPDAFVKVYKALYKPLYYLSSSLYKNSSTQAEDVIHDAFVALWEMKSAKFESISAIKSYIYVSVRNRFKNYLNHAKCEGKYVDNIINDKSSFVSHIAEIETLSVIAEAIELLPPEWAKVFQLHVNGWSIKDIANKLNKAQSTVYAQKKEAISILKKKIHKDKLLILMTLIN